MKYRKKPIVIEAFQFTDPFTCTDPMIPLWFVDAVDIGKVRSAPTCVLIKTLEGEMMASIGDWIIRGVKGEIYPCKPDIFEATYEPVE